MRKGSIHTKAKKPYRSKLRQQRWREVEATAEDTPVLNTFDVICFHGLLLARPSREAGGTRCPTLPSATAGAFFFAFVISRFFTELHPQ
jgi:hypothetical protein